jgi:hypothetical protein
MAATKLLLILLRVRLSRYLNPMAAYLTVNKSE